MHAEDFLQAPFPLLDIRSPSEYCQGHIPGAISFPLFSDLERSEVGTLYKKEGKDSAVKMGLHFIGPRLHSMIEQAEKLLPDSCKAFRIYCWRGGMRSQSVAWLLQTAGFDCQLLQGGYKSFRRWALTQFEKSYHFCVLGGFTGSGKTELLHQLKEEGEQVIDLEALARHRGSCYGHLGWPGQPSTEYFENLLACHISGLNPDYPIWIEDESRQIGSCHIPQGLWKQMQQAPFAWLESPRQERIKRLLHIYGSHPHEKIVEATQKLSKKLGLVRTKEIVDLIRNQKLECAISAILEHYDASYDYSCHKQKRKPLSFDHTDQVLNQLKAFSKGMTQTRLVVFPFQNIHTMISEHAYLY